MSILISTMAGLGRAAPLFHEGGNETLATWKAILTSVLLVVAMLQVLGQVVVRGWIPGVTAKGRGLLRLHRAGGALALVLVVVLCGLGLYSYFGEGYRFETATGVSHVVLGALAAAILLGKAAISNLARGRLSLNRPLGVALGAIVPAIFLITALPHLLDLLAPKGMAILFVP